MVDEMFDRDPRQKIGKQIVLPLRRAIEISLKSLKIRFWRSMITVSSIILAIAFLSFVLINTTILRALKDGPSELVEGLEVQLRDLEQSLGPEEAGKNPEFLTLRRKLARETMERDQTLVLLRSEGAGDEDESSTLTGPKESGGFFADFKAKDYWLITLALLVCFVGIVNAMLMSVTERFREIGTMKCLGALDSFIVKLFVLESVFQGSIGTFFGITLGGALSILRAWWSYGNVTFRFFPWVGFLACVGIAQGIGTLLTIVAATFPARAAARMQPVDALRADQ